MDLSQDIIYRAFKLNDASILTNMVPGPGVGSGIVGSVVDHVDFSDVDVVQFIEKRAQRDGMDAGDPFLGTRRIRITGTLYDVSRALLYDRMWALRAALSPVLAQRESPLDHGYRPLTFASPTNDTVDFPSGYMDLQVNALPRAIDVSFQRNQIGGNELDSLAIPWTATLICKDPSITMQLPQDVTIDRAPGTVSGNWTNRGTYICPVNMLIVVGSAAGSIAVTVGDANFTITVPASTGNRTIRFKGEDTVLTLEENSVEVPRRDLLVFGGDTSWPYVPVGSSAYSVTYTSVTAAAGSHMWFYERMA